MSDIYNITGCKGSWSNGVWWFRIKGYGLMLKAPWAGKLFSERNGKREYWPKDGWRIRVLKRKYEQ